MLGGMRQVSFTRMDEGTAQDYQLTKVEENAMIADFPDRSEEHTSELQSH